MVKHCIKGGGFNGLMMDEISMKKFLVNALRGTLILGEALLAGCSTPSFSSNRKPKEPIPEDTIIKRSFIPKYAVMRERAIAAPMRPEPEPDEVLIVEPEIEEVKLSPVLKPTGAEYSVQRNDSLYWLAKKYGIRLQDLLDANGFDRNAKLRLGQKIILPGVTEEQLARSSSSPGVHIVTKGDCLSKIAQKYGLKVSEIKAANAMKSDRIIAGQKIIIPERGRYANHGKTEAKPIIGEEKGFAIDSEGYFVIRKGYTLSKIAALAKVSVGDLQKWNHLKDPSKVRIGQKIMVRPRNIPEFVAAKPREPEPENAPMVSLQESMPVRRYDFVDDADFFGKIDEIPIIQVKD
ncbi:MAG: LysM peptidoglycan-binding domain-containing protein [Puniceicoccales bacterium]|jgi:LysM repeat protein|nr:LysM peptidoglycan-binding domain-containing protein [Puniceicoccales bacterium]